MKLDANRPTPPLLHPPLRILEQQQNQIQTQHQQQEVGQKENRGAEASAGQAALQLLQQLQQHLFERSDNHSEREKTLGKTSQTSQANTPIQDSAFPANPNPPDTSPSKNPFQQPGFIQKALESLKQQQTISPASSFPSLPPQQTISPASSFPSLPPQHATPTSGDLLQQLQQLSFPAPSKDLQIQQAQQRAQQAIQATGPATQHPYMQRQAEILQNLKDAQLPNRADGVRLMVIDSIQDHGDEVVRAAAGHGGLAQGADIRLHGHLPPEQAAPGNIMTPAEQQQYATDLQTVLAATQGMAYDPQTGSSPQDFQKMGLDQLGQIGANAETTFLTMRRREVAHALEMLPKDGQTSIVNMSWGMSPVKYADAVAQHALHAPEGSKLHQEITTALGRPPSLADHNHDGKPDDLVAVRGIIADRVSHAMQDPAHRQKTEKTREKLAQELAAGRQQGVLFINAAGNEHKIAEEIGRPALSANFSNGTPGLLTVGAAEPYNAQQADPKNKPTWNYNSTLAMSSAGAQVMAPGVMPIADPITMQSVRPGVPAPVDPSDPLGRPTPGTVNGTSFAAPYLAGVAALMIKANPAITPDQIEKILTDPRNATDDPNTTRDGAGSIHPQKAIQAAVALSQ
jgi:hypothetical protein